MTVAKPITIFMLAGSQPSLMALEAGIPPLLDLGAKVEIATRRKPETDFGDWPVTSYQLRPRVDEPVQRHSPRWIQSVWRGRVVRRLARRRDTSTATMMLAFRDPDAFKGLSTADIVVALDNPAVYTIWKIGQRRSDGDLVFGLPEALIRARKLASERHIDADKQT